MSMGAGPETQAPVAAPGTEPVAVPVPRRGRRSRVVAGAVLAALLAAGGAAVAVRRDPPAAGAHPRPAPTSHAPAPTTTSSGDRFAAERRTAVPALLKARGAAVVARDRAAWEAGLDPRSPSFLTEQERTFANLAAIGFAKWSYEVVSDLPADPAVVERLGAPARSVHVRLRLRIAGFDRGDAVRNQYLTVVRRDGRWLVAGDHDTSADPDLADLRDLWDLGTLSVVRGRRVLVIGHASVDELQRYEREAERAIDAVSQVVGTRWPRRTVVEVPGSAADLDSLLGRIDRSIDIDSYAAVAFPERTDTRGADGHLLLPTRVAVNPHAFDEMDAEAARDVLTHEMTHVSWFDQGGGVAEWLTEGFADYVGFRGVPDADIASDVVADVRRGRLPSELPTDGDFQHGDSVDLAYQRSTTLCRAIAHHWGQAALLGLYRAAAASDESDVDVATSDAIRSVLHTTPAGLVRVWREYLRGSGRG